LDEAELKQVNLQEDIESVLLVLKNRIVDRSDHLVTKLVCDLGKIPLIQCYSAKINQVLLNIIDNSIDAVEENLLKKNITTGEILIQTSVVNDQEIAVRIIDNGIGIPENLITKIFDPFFTTKPVGKGTGLGLAIAHAVIVEQHHGSLTCRITEDQKTEFTIVLPIVHRLYRSGIRSK
jgi:signal transduction histidine kinase